jgi:predicted dehydrogenase
MMPQARRPRLGFLGTGWIGRHRLAAIVSSGVAEVAMVADPSPAAAADAARLAPAAAVRATLDEMLNEDLDGLVIATPSALHAEQAIAAMERGLAVFCQKPLARTSAEARQVVDTARDTDRLLGLDLSYRHLAGASDLRRLIHDGELGSVFTADVTFHNAYGPDKAWCRDRALAGGGCLIDLGVHLVDLALWMLDFPAVTGVTSRLFANGRPFQPVNGGVEDFVSARLDLATGATVSLACSWNLPAGQDAVIRIACYGTGGGAAIQNVDGSFYDFRTERYRGTTRETLSLPPDPWGGRAIVEWASRLGADPRFDPAAQQFVAVAAVLDRVYAS